MKTLLLALSAIVLSHPVFAKDFSLSNADSKVMMSTLAGAGFKIKNIDKEWWVAGTLSVETGPVLCHYSAAVFPDNWLSDSACYKGDNSSGEELKNPMALALAIQPFASEEAGLGNRWMQVKNISCALDYQKKIYACKVTADAGE